MANLRVFVSSTAYDLGVLRSALRGFVEGLGYDAVLSDYSDVLYDPREHAHKSCLEEVRTCDIVVLIIGSRFGSALDPEVLKSSLHEMDAQHLQEGESSPCLSVTQAEALAAAGSGIPLFAFVEAAVLHDHSVFQTNLGKPFAKDITYPSISQPETAEYIFNFIDYLRGRSYNNAVIPFDRMEDVVGHLQKQWAALFQRMLAEARAGRDDSVRIDRLADKFEDLKAALLATVGDAGSRETARAVIRSRRLVEFLRALPNRGVPMREAFIAGDQPFWELLRTTADVVGVEEDARAATEGVGSMWPTVLRTTEGPALRCRFSRHLLDRLEADWQNVRGLSAAERAVIYDALLDTDDRGLAVVRRLPVEVTRPRSLGAVGGEGDAEHPQELANDAKVERGSQGDALGARGAAARPGSRRPAARPPKSVTS